MTNAMIHAGCEQYRIADEGLSPSAAPAVMAFIFKNGKIDVSTNVLALPHGRKRADEAGATAAEPMSIDVARAGRRRRNAPGGTPPGRIGAGPRGAGICATIEAPS